MDPNIRPVRPTHNPHVLDGTTCAEPARPHRQSTGAPWLQPLGLAHALLETAHPGPQGPRLAVVSNTALRDVPITRDLTPAR